MMKMVRRHLERKYVVQEEELLERIAESTERGTKVTIANGLLGILCDGCPSVCQSYS